MSSVNKSMILLEKLSQAPYEYTLAELSKEIDCTKSGAFKILEVLIQHGFVQQRNNKYSLGSAVLNLQASYEKQEINWDVCQPVLEELRNVTGETCTIAKWENNYAHILYRVRSLENLRVEGNIGRTLPLNASAHGKLLGAYLDDKQLERILSTQPLQKLCPNTISDVNQLKEEYRKIREDKLSVSIEESSVGAAGIAAPIFGASGNVIASLCCGTPTIRLTEEKKKMVIENVKKYAQKLSETLQNAR